MPNSNRRLTVSSYTVIDSSQTQCIHEECVCAVAEFFSTAPLKIFSWLIIQLPSSTGRFTCHDSRFRSAAAVENIKIICKSILFIHNTHINYNVNIY